MFSVNVFENFSMLFWKNSGCFLLMVSSVFVVRVRASFLLKAKVGVGCLKGNGSSIMLSGRILVLVITSLRNKISS